MSMILFALNLNPLLHVLEQTLTGIRTSRRSKKAAVLAYADGITILVTAPEDIPVIRDAILTYEMATGNPEIQSYGGRSIGHHNRHDRHPLLQGNEDTVCQLH